MDLDDLSPELQEVYADALALCEQLRDDPAGVAEMAPLRTDAVARMATNLGLDLGDTLTLPATVAGLLVAFAAAGTYESGDESEWIASMSIRGAIAELAVGMVDHVSEDRLESWL